MRSLPRREFFADTAKLAAAMAAIPGVKAVAAPDDGEGDTKPGGPNDTVRMAVCGVNGRGKDHIAGWSQLKDVRITAICDVDLRVAGRGAKLVERNSKTAPKVVQDIRRLLDDKTIDAISIATPNHWHALATIWACQAGKDVYVEKPVSHNVSEGRRMVEAARRHERIVQTGTQCRSHKGIQDAMAFLRSGKLGKIYMAKGLCYKPRGSIGHQGRLPGSPLTSITTSGSGRRPSGRSTPIDSTTTGTGTGITATATWATRESTRWTWPAGAWARANFPRRSWLPAAASAIPTTARRRTRFTSASSSTTASFNSRFAGF